MKMQASNVFSVIWSKVLKVTNIFGKDSTTPVTVGDAVSSSSMSLSSEDDLHVTGNFEAEGVIATNSNKVRVYAASGNKDTEVLFYENGTVSATLRSDFNQNQFLIGTGTATDRQVVITDYSNVGKNHDHATQTNPTLYVHSATNPDTDNTEWISMTHDKANGIIAAGSGATCLQCHSGAELLVGTTKCVGFFISGAQLWAAVRQEGVDREGVVCQTLTTV